MSQKPQVNPSSLRDVKVESVKKKTSLHNPRPVYVIERDARKTRSSMSSNFVYVNSAYEGSLDNVNERRVNIEPEPPTSVIREQYWACSKWPYTQRILAIAVGVLLGAVVGLAVTVALRADDKDRGGIVGIFRSNPAPD